MMDDPAGEARICALLRAMTLEEKLGQLSMVAAHMAVTGPALTPDWLAGVRDGRVGSVLNLWGRQGTGAAQRAAVAESRLGIPLLLGFDVVHGHRTIFPIPLAEAGAFDPELWERTARAAALEAAADGLNLTFAPMLDVARDPRWGRIAESPGEDPWIASWYARAKVRGFQGGDLARADVLAATAKHFAGYGAVTGGRDYAPVELSARTLHEVHLPAFAAAVDAGVAAVMPAFTDLAGIPMTAHVGLLRDTLRGRWGFDGVIVSDFGAIGELVVHGIAGDEAEAAAAALKAGVDIDMMSGAYARGLPQALARGLVAPADVDAAVARVLRLKARLGLFADPYGRMAADRPAATAEPRLLAREAARRSIVLLQDHDRRLPVVDDPRRVAVLGPLADAGPDMRGPWYGAGAAEAAVSFAAGLQQALPGATVTVVAGSAVDTALPGGIGAAVAAARTADLVLLCLGEHEWMSGEAACRARPELPPCQDELATAVLAAAPRTIVALAAGRPLVAPDLFRRASTVFATWFAGAQAGPALADLILGVARPSARLAVTWPADAGQIPLHYGARPGGRPARAGERYTSKYLDAPVTPQFAFGHGLTYGDCRYGPPAAEPSVLRPGQSTTVTVVVENAGRHPADDTVLLFIRDPVASIARPALELRGVSKAVVPPGGRVTVSFTLSTADLAFLDAGLEPCLEPGHFEIHVGPSAAPELLRHTVIEVVADSAESAPGQDR